MKAHFLHNYKSLVKGETRHLGKLFRVGDIYVLFRGYLRRSSYHRKLDALSFDFRLVPELEKWHVAEIHHVFTDARPPSEMYVITFADAISKGFEDNQGEGREIYVRMPDWRVISPPPYREEYGEKTVWIKTPQEHREKPPKEAKPRKKPGGTTPTQQSFLDPGPMPDPDPGLNYPD